MPFGLSSEGPTLGGWALVVILKVSCRTVFTVALQDIPIAYELSLHCRIKMQLINRSQRLEIILFKSGFQV